MADGSLASDLYLGVDVFTGVECLVFPRISGLGQSVAVLDRMNLGVVLRALDQAARIRVSLVLFCLFFVADFEPRPAPFIQLKDTEELLELLLVCLLVLCHWILSGVVDIVPCVPRRQVLGVLCVMHLRNFRKPLHLVFAVFLPLAKFFSGFILLCIDLLPHLSLLFSHCRGI